MLNINATKMLYSDLQLLTYTSSGLRCIVGNNAVYSLYYKNQIHVVFNFQIKVPIHILRQYETISNLVEN